MNTDPIINRAQSGTQPDSEMTLRDRLAAAAIHTWDVQIAFLFSHKWGARLMYRRADAILAERAMVNPE